MEFIELHKGAVTVTAVSVLVIAAATDGPFLNSLFATALLLVCGAVIAALIKPTLFGANSNRRHLIKLLGIVFSLLIVALIVTAPPITDRAVSPQLQAGNVNAVEPKTIAETKKTEPAPPIPKAKYEAVAGRSSMLDPKTRVVLVTVSNVGDAPGSPKCFVRATSLSGNYKGYDTFGSREVPVLKEIAAGEEAAFYARLTITDEGAMYATEAIASCS